MAFTPFGYLLRHQELKVRKNPKSLNGFNAGTAKAIEDTGWKVHGFDTGRRGVFWCPALEPDFARAAIPGSSRD